WRRPPPESAQRLSHQCGRENFRQHRNWSRRESWRRCRCVKRRPSPYHSSGNSRETRRQRAFKISGKNDGSNFWIAGYVFWRGYLTSLFLYKQNSPYRNKPPSLKKKRTSHERVRFFFNYA